MSNHDESLIEQVWLAAQGHDDPEVARLAAISAVVNLRRWPLRDAVAWVEEHAERIGLPALAA